jgi:hypothetical protein
MGKPGREKPRSVPRAEREQVRIRRKIGAAVIMDMQGRERAPVGTAEAAMQYSETNKVVRVRSYDPLTELHWLTVRQRRAGMHYRVHYEVLVSAGFKPPSLEMKVDGGGAGKDIPTRTLDAASAVRRAHQACGHPDIAAVVEHVCGMRQSIREASTGTGKRRDALIALLPIGLDQMAAAFFGAERRSG